MEIPLKIRNKPPNDPAIPFLDIPWVSEVAQSCPTLCNRVDCSLPGFSLHGILQARIQQWVAISFSRVSSQPRDWTWIKPALQADTLTTEPPGKPEETKIEIDTCTLVFIYNS